MTDVKEVLRRWTAGQSNKAIARETRIDRKTVRRYIEVAKKLGADARDATLTDAVVHEIAQRVQARPLPEPSDACARDRAGIKRADREVAQQERPCG